MSGEPIHVAFGVDDKYAPHLAVTIASIVANMASDQALVVHVMHNGVTAKNQHRVEAAAPRAQFQWHEVDAAALPNVDGAVIKHLSAAALNRLTMQRFIEGDRVIYLDCDVVVVADLADLWRQELHGQPVGAVQDALIAADAFAERWDLPRDPAARYFNSGVLLIDLRAVRDSGAFDRALALVAAHPHLAHYADQCALNVVFWRAWTRLDPRWNVQRAMVTQRGEQPCALELAAHNRSTPRIIHYTSNRKPWLRTAYHPYAGAYWDYLPRTPFAAEVTAASGVSTARRLAWRARWRLNAARLKLADRGRSRPL